MIWEPVKSRETKYLWSAAIYNSIFSLLCLWLIYKMLTCRPSHGINNIRVTLTERPRCASGLQSLGFRALQDFDPDGQLDCSHGAYHIVGRRRRGLEGCADREVRHSVGSTRTYLLVRVCRSHHFCGINGARTHGLRAGMFSLCLIQI